MTPYSDTCVTCWRNSAWWPEPHRQNILSSFPIVGQCCRHAGAQSRAVPRRIARVSAQRARVAAPVARGRRGDAHPLAVDAELPRARHVGSGDESLPIQRATRRGPAVSAGHPCGCCDACDWRKRTGIGTIGGSMARSPIRAASLPAAQPPRFWNGTGSSRCWSGVGRRPGSSFRRHTGNRLWPRTSSPRKCRFAGGYSASSGGSSSSCRRPRWRSQTPHPSRMGCG